jgi:hypothetical protein
MLWIEGFRTSIVHFVVLILFFFFFMGRPVHAFEQASMDWILQGLIARGSFFERWYLLVVLA